MAYLSSTSTSPNVPIMSFQPVAGPKTWVYSSTHVSSDIEAAHFFTDGLNLGMGLADALLHYPSSDSTEVATAHMVIAVGATTTEVSVGTTLAGHES